MGRDLQGLLLLPTAIIQETRCHNHQLLLPRRLQHTYSVRFHLFSLKLAEGEQRYLSLAPHPPLAKCYDVRKRTPTSPNTEVPQNQGPETCGLYPEEEAGMASDSAEEATMVNDAESNLRFSTGAIAIVL